jgi:amino acid transporter, AAT family
VRVFRRGTSGLDQLSANESPFVTVFNKIGIATAAGIVNFVVLTAALFSCNSGIFSTGRLLYTLSGVRQASAEAGRGQERSTTTVGAMWAWGVIVISHLVYRRRVAAGEVAASPFRMPGSPLTNWIVVAFLAFVGVLLAFNASQRVALYAGAVWAVAIVVAYAVYRRRAARAAE